MSQVLRHGARDLGLNLQPGGWILVRELLAHDRFRGACEHDIRAVVTNCPKKRFELEEHVEGLQVRACQGHSLDIDDDEHLLERLALSSTSEVAIHGTKLDAWSKIRIGGLSKMGRNHVHLATGLPNEQSVVSGTRSDSTVLIYVDVPQAMEDGVQFWRAANGVVLTRGAGDTGILPRQYFTRVRVRGSVTGEWKEMSDWAPTD
jgi:RNA:NAD 2'-phosphotransferase (TPT1/KptA family)